ncbi:MAG TPA: DUF3943 domain-containing protein [Thermoanaerobaculia bacterium]|nr:DUF3943 domain-containing protein [Thermoanaerobaculia bacterium]
MSFRPPARTGGTLGFLLVACLAALPAGAEERFHLFPESESPPPGLRVQLEGLPPAAPLAALAAARARPSSRRSEPTSPKAPEALPPYPTEERFATAALETLALDVVPWVINRYGSKEFFAYVSTDTIRNNLQTGFTYDHDVFSTNSGSHPYHGSANYNAARTSGFSFWESGAFTLGGSFLWEMFTENQPPALNDLVNTTLGGMAWGELEYRSANLILDNTKSGLERFLREAGAFVVNPMGGLNRIFRGEVSKDFQNLPDRFPAKLYLELDAGYVHAGGAAAEGTEPDQGAFSFVMRYGDPFDGEVRHAFDVFETRVELRQPAPVLFTQLDIDGLLVSWNISGSSPARQQFAFFMRSSYFNNDPRTFGAQSFGARHLMSLPLGRETDLRTEASVLAMPLAAVGVDYPVTAMGSPIGRYYDFGPGLGARASARVRRREVDLLAVTWSLTGTNTSNGISRSSRVQTLSAEARLPLTSRLLLGGGWTWNERLTTYTWEDLPAVHLTGTSWRVFAGWSIPETHWVPDRPAEAGGSTAERPDVAGRWDVSAFAGAFFGTRVLTSMDLAVLMATAPVYGLRAGYNLTRVLGLEASWSHAATKLLPKDPVTGAPAGAATSAAVDSWELDGLFGFGGRAVRGYVGIGAGAQEIRPNVSNLDPPGTTTRFAANIAIGGLFFVTPNVAFRADGRYRWRVADERVGTFGCEPPPVGCKPFTTDLFSSGELTGGVTFRF